MPLIEANEYMREKRGCGNICGGQWTLGERVGVEILLPKTQSFVTL